MRIVVNVLGREVLVIYVGRGQGSAVDAEPREQTLPDEHDPQDHVRSCGRSAPEPRTLGFHGGSGGSTELGWQPDADRPIDAQGADQ